MSSPEQVVLLNSYGYTSKADEVDPKKLIETKLTLPEKFNLLGLLSACEELQSIDIPEGETFETLFDITIHGLQQNLSIEENEKMKNVKYKNAIEKILSACQHFYEQITNKGLTGDVLNLSIDILFNGKKSKYTGNTEYYGLTQSGIIFPLILAKTVEDRNRILTKFKQVANLYILKGFKFGRFMTPEEIEESFFKGVSGVGASVYRGGGRRSFKKRTKSAKRKSIKRKSIKRSRSNRRRHRRTARK